LTPYKSWKVADASVTSDAVGNISSFPDDNITEYSEVGDYNLQVPGKLGKHGTTFTDKCKASS
jgi:hypothetical protein